MSDSVIVVEKLSKQYRLGQVGRKTLHADFNRFLYRTLGKEDPYLKIGETNDRSVKGTSEYVWALRDINFEVKRGEVLGIIGRNGAGKSTLLKVLSKVTSPTEGQIKIKGRIASLLEVGTGFHPELSGRDNIFLNGAILGMTRKEIKNKFDEIVDFAGVERYIDTPVKRYSSGMYVRLAFAVAAHLEPDILIVDEVLAVGDAEFQKKCLGKMKDVSAKDGRTVLFVSHNMDVISRLCQNTVYLKNGLVAEIGLTDTVINNYLIHETAFSSSVKYESDFAPGSETVKLLSAEVIDDNMKNKLNFFINEKVGIKIKFEVLTYTNDLRCGFNLSNVKDMHILTSHDIYNDEMQYLPGCYSTIVWIPGNLLSEGAHYCGIACMTYKPFKVHFHDINKISFNISDTYDNSTARGKYSRHLPGVVRPLLKWSTIKKEI